MANPDCFGSLQVCRLRVAQLDAAGLALGGATGLVSDAIVSLQVGVDVQAGDEFTQKNGCGSIAEYFKDADHIKRLTFTMNLCQLDANLIQLLTDATLYSSGGNAIGWQYPSVSAASSNGVCLEVWTKAWDGTAQAVPAFTSPNAAYWHWVFPKTTWVMGQVQMDNSIMVVPLTGQGLENAQLGGNGPFNDWPAAVTGGVTRVGGVFLDSAIPTATCGKVTAQAGS